MRYENVDHAMVERWRPIGSQGVVNPTKLPDEATSSTIVQVLVFFLKSLGRSMILATLYSGYH